MLLRVLFLALLLGANHRIYSQFFAQNGFGAQIGLSFNLGTHFNRIGVQGQLYYFFEHVQFNLSVQAFHNFRAFPMGRPSWELQAKAGLLLSAGAKHPFYYQYFVSETGNQTSRPIYLGYSYNFYFDSQQTTQQTGTAIIGLYNVALVVENDFLAFQNQDKYRTGALSIQYHNGRNLIELAATMWTCDPYAEGTLTVSTDSLFPAKYGYRNTANTAYNNLSVGALALKYQRYLDVGQGIGFAAGIDAEQIRNFIQNRMIHDSALLKDPHIPMLDRTGASFLYRPGQQLRAPLFYLQFMANSNGFY